MSDILQSVGNALGVLDLLSKYDELGVAEVARYMGVAKSTAFRLLATLEKNAYVYKSRDSRYRLGMKLAMLGDLAVQRMEIVSMVHPYLTELNRSLKETTHLIIWDGGLYITVMDRVLGTSFNTQITSIGFRYLAHATACGKAVLAYANEEARQKYFKQLMSGEAGEFTEEDCRVIDEELKEIRLTRVSCDDEKNVPGLTCFAVPILDHTGHALASIGVSGITVGLWKNKDHIVTELWEASNKISDSIIRGL